MCGRPAPAPASTFVALDPMTASRSRVIAPARAAQGRSVRSAVQVGLLRRRDRSCWSRWAGIMVSLLIGGWPALPSSASASSPRRWNPVTDVFGAAGPIVGTLVSSVLALVISLPMAFGVAVFLVEFCPTLLRRPIGMAVELLAGIPSIVYGMWGLFVFAPFFAQHVQLPLMTRRAARLAAGNADRRRAQRRQHPHRLDHPGDHDPALHGRGAARAAADRAGAAARERLRHGLDLAGGGHVRSRLPYVRRSADRRGDAGPRPRAGRDHGGDLHHRQFAQPAQVAVRLAARPSPRPSPTSSTRPPAPCTPRR